MIALSGVGGVFNLAEQGVHFGAVEAAAGSDGAVAGHGRADFVNALDQGLGLIPFRQFIT